MTPTQLPPNVQALKARWEADRKSRIFGQLAEEYRKLNLLDDAIALCREGLKLHPGHFTAMVTLGRALMGKGENMAAAGELQQVIDASPGNITANKLLGEIFHQRGDFRNALKCFDMVKQLNPLDEEVAALVDDLKARLGSESREKDFVEAHREMSRGVPIDFDESSTVMVSAADLEASRGLTDDEPIVRIFEEETSSEIEVSGGEIVEQEEDAILDTDGEPDEDFGLKLFPDEDDENAGETADEAAETSAEKETAEGPNDFGLKFFSEGSEDDAEEEEDEGSFTALTDELVPDVRLFDDDSGGYDGVPTEEDESADGDEDGMLTSETLAQLYERQGHPDRALKIYEKMLLRDPASEFINDRIQELTYKISGASALASADAGEPLQEKEPAVEAVSSPAVSVKEEDVKRLREEISGMKNPGRQKKIRTLNNWLNTVKKEKRD